MDTIAHHLHPPDERLDKDIAALLPPGAALRDDALVLGGVDVRDLASRFGTPLYVYDEDAIRLACRAYMDAFVHGRPRNHIHYAAKAYLAPWLCRVLRDEGLGLDVVSGGELHVALAGGMPGAAIRMHGGAKERGEIADALDAGVGSLVADGMDDLTLIAEVAERTGRRAPVMLRLAPGVEAETHHYLQTSRRDGKFGVPVAEGADPGPALRAFVDAALSSPHLEVQGYHAHVGSNLFDPLPVALTLRRLLDVAQVIHRDTGYWPDQLCPGGGLGIAYQRGERAIPVAALAGAVLEEMEEGAAGRPVPALSLEPGRSIVGRAGVALYGVGARKDVEGARYVAVDGGMADNIRPALYGAAYTALAATKMTAAPEGVAHVAGRCCESGDILVRDALLPPLERGDLLALPAAGAYCLAMSSLYNGVPRPAVVVVRNGAARLVQRRGVPADLLAYDVEV